MGCSKFLDVNPKGETFDADMFSSGEGYEDALYGVYAEMATGEYLYGGYYHWLPEVMSGNVTAVGDYKLGNMALADWYTAGPISIRKSVWSDTYEAINHVNNIIMHVEEGGEDEFKYSKLYKGEALAIRALLHFELTRFFGAPQWADASLKAEGIPYVTDYSFSITPFSSLDGTYEMILEDLSEAERCLAEDSELVPAVRTNTAGGFTDARITHLNLYAVQALTARVYWSKGDLAKAAEYAEKVIDSGKFSFRPLSAFVQPDHGTLDLNETIFGLYVGRSSSSYQTRNNTKYRLSGSTSSTSFLLASDWRSLYDDGSAASGSDYRLGSWFDDAEETLVKLVNPIYYNSTSSSYSGNSYLGCNILRLPEMYYIMAEYQLSLGNVSAAEEWFDAVTVTRGLDSLRTLGATLDYDRLYRERRKEFYGEGFTWHEMKKLGKDITGADGRVLDGSVAGTYTIPIPDDEYEYRNNIEQ